MMVGALFLVRWLVEREAGPAQAAGVCADDEVVAIDGLRADAEAFDAMLDRLAFGREVRLTLFRRDELVETRLAPAEPPRDTCFLALDKGASPAAAARCRQWLPVPAA